MFLEGGVSVTIVERTGVSLYKYKHNFLDLHGSVGFRHKRLGLVDSVLDVPLSTVLDLSLFPNHSEKRVQTPSVRIFVIER